MTVCKYYLKSFYRDKNVFLIWFAIFILITIVVGGTPNSNQKNYFFKSELRIAMSEKIEKDDNLGIKKAFDDEYDKISIIANDENKAKEAVYIDGVNLAIIKDEESGKIVAFSNKADAKSFLAKEKLRSFMDFVELSLKDGKKDLETASKIAQAHLDVNLIQKHDADYIIKTWYFYTFRFIAYPLMAVIMSIIGLSSISFKSRENKIRSAISSMKMLRQNAEAFFAQFLTMLIILVFAFLVVLIIGQGGNIKYVSTLANLFALSLSSLGMIFLLYHINDSKHFIGAIAGLFPLCLSFISGVFVDIELLPKLSTNIARFFPMFYYIKGNELAKDGFSSGLLFYMGIQVLFAVSYFLLGVLIEKYFSKAS